ncbi:MAG: hypothetical protein PHV61_03385 [Limnochordia bacterium]|nr:hypothetical protein [Limnochordia bacterium]
MRLSKRKKEDIVILLVITLIALAIGQGLPVCVPPVQPCGKARYRKANMKDIVRAVQAHYDSLRLYRRLFRAMVLVIAFLWVLKAQTDAAGAMTDGGILSVGASLGKHRRERVRVDHYDDHIVVTGRI